MICSLDELEDLGVDRFVVPLETELDQDLGVLDPLGLLVELRQDRFDPGPLPLLFLRPLLVVPVPGLRRLRL